MTYNKWLPQAAMIALFCVSFSVSAQQGSVAADSGRDQSRASPLSRVFSVHDSDHNGVLSRDEYAQFVEQMEKRKFHRNQSPRRHVQPLRFDQIDSNQDGVLNENEMVNALNARLQQQRRHRYRGERY